MGFGGSGFGSSPYGIGTPTSASSGGKILRNTLTGQSTGSRRLDPKTKDYVLDEYGRIEGMSNVQQLVLVAVSTEQGSSAVRTLGQDLKKIDRITNNFEKRVENVLRAALSHLTDDNLIEIKSITTTRLPTTGRAYTKLVWRDLTTDLEHSEEIGK